jgi:hypothetical protein
MMTFTISVAHENMYNEFLGHSNFPYATVQYSHRKHGIHGNGTRVLKWSKND